MDREAAYKLFADFLRRKDCKEIDLSKELPGLLEYGKSCGCFANPHTVHSALEWRKFGDKIQDALVDDDKMTKKWAKKWRTIMNLLLAHEAEKRAVEGALGIQGENKKYADEWFGSTPLPPSMKTGVLISAPGSSTVEPQAEDPPISAASSAPPYVPEPSVSVPEMEVLGAQAVARKRRECWAQVARHEAEKGGGDLAFPVLYTPGQGGIVNYEIYPLDWKILVQTRETAKQYGINAEPTRQMLNYIWNVHVLLPGDLRRIMQLLLSPSQQLMCSSYWHQECQCSVDTQRGPGDPLNGVTMEELMGVGIWSRMEVQPNLGPDKLKESMRCFRCALDRIQDQGGPPPCMNMKQERNEPLGTFVDRLIEAIT